MYLITSQVVATTAVKGYLARMAKYVAPFGHFNHKFMSATSLNYSLRRGLVAR